MINIAKRKTGLLAKGRENSGIIRILREIQATDAPTRTGDGPRRQAEKLSDEENCANKNRFISEGPEKLSGKTAKRRRL